MAELHEGLAQVPDLALRESEPMSRHTPLRVGGPVEAWVLADTVDALRAAIKEARSRKLNWKVHWPFEDWLVQDGPWPAMVIRPGQAFEGIARLDEDLLRIGAATPWAALSALGPKGWWSDMIGWPGCPGATLSLGEAAALWPRVRQIRLIRGRGVDNLVLDPEADPPSWPPSTVPVDLELGPARRLHRRPRVGPRPPGTLFKDPDHALAGEILERARLGGTRLRAWRLSEVEPATLVNLGGGSCHDALLLAKGLQARIDRARGVQLSLRPPVHGQELRRR